MSSENTLLVGVWGRARFEKGIAKEQRIDKVVCSKAACGEFYAWPMASVLALVVGAVHRLFRSRSHFT